MEKKPKKKTWNLTPHPILKRYVEEFVDLNGRSSATAVVEEALREFFEKRGIQTDVPPEELIKRVARALEEEGRDSGTGEHATK